MSKRHAPWAILAILFVSYGVARLPGLLVASAVLGAGYLVSIRLHPRTACRKCKGSGRFYGWLAAGPRYLFVKEDAGDTLVIMPLAEFARLVRNQDDWSI